MCELWIYFFRYLISFFLSSIQVSILDTGEVCMELLKCQSGQERVKEVLRISCDGSMVQFLWGNQHLSCSYSINLSMWKKIFSLVSCGLL